MEPTLASAKLHGWNRIRMFSGSVEETLVSIHQQQLADFPRISRVKI
jgi:hypothetical protein